jgi:type IV pilus assembly protein PilQ
MKLRPIRSRLIGFVMFCLSLTLNQVQADTRAYRLEAQDLRLAEALELLAQQQGLVLDFQASLQQYDRIISTDAAAGTFSELLDVLLDPTGLNHEIQGGRLIIRAASEVLAKSPGNVLLTRFIQIKYADADTLLQLIEGSGAAGLLSDAGNVWLDERTGTLIVRDVPDRVSEVEVLLTELDVPVSQVLIEARIVSASLETGRELGVRWGISAAENSDSDSGFELSLTHQAAGRVRDGLVRNSRLLEWELNLLQNRGQADLIARPRVMTQDNTAASIRSGVRIPYQAQAGGTAGGSITEFVDAVLSLEVKPRITPDGRILLSLQIRQDSVASGSAEVPAINTNTIDTQVLIDNTDTLVLGGIFREEQTQTRTGTPVLQSAPLVGGLFRRTLDADRHTELLIFITPRIVPSP